MGIVRGVEARRIRPGDSTPLGWKRREYGVGASKVKEIGEELRSVFDGRGSVVDSIVPPIVFFGVNALAGFAAAFWVSLVVGALIAGLRVRRHQSLAYAVGGLGGVVLAAGVAKVLGRAGGFFLPGVISDSATATLCVVSVVAGRPLVALTSAVVRRWPLPWYWHPRVRPAYGEVTWVWAAFFAARMALHYSLLRSSAGLLAILGVATDWPATILLLVASYLYGTWRLRRLGGPSVDEFKAGVQPPWASQRRGF
jgi:hypothetical protein